jgi:hypothetical protein
MDRVNSRQHMNREGALVPANRQSHERNETYQRKDAPQSQSASPR